jgi:hypothetical protein
MPLHALSVEKRPISGKAAVVDGPRTTAALEASVQPGDPSIPVEANIASVVPTDAQVVANGIKPDDPLLATAVAEEHERHTLALGFQPPLEIHWCVQNSRLRHRSARDKQAEAPL